MLGRRGLLGLLIGAPVLAARVAPSQLGTADVVYPDDDFFPSEQPSPLEELYRKYRQKHYDRAEMLREPVDYLPPHIATKKSWSDAFKKSEYRKEIEAHRELWNYDVRDPETMMRALKSVGAKL